MGYSEAQAVQAKLLFKTLFIIPNEVLFGGNYSVAQVPALKVKVT